MKKKLFLILVMASVALLGACSDSEKPSVSEKETTSATETETASETSSEEQSSSLSWINFNATNLEGEAIDPDILTTSKLTMVDMWGTFCSPCIREMPDLGEIAKEYDKAEFQVIGIVLDTVDQQGGIDPGQVDVAKKIVLETGADYLNLLPSQDLIELALREVYSIPEKRFIDSEGNQIGDPIIGSKTKEEWVAIINEKLEAVK